MAARAIRITFQDYMFEPADFNPFDGEFSRRFMADVIALVTPCEEAITVELLSIERDPDRKEIESFIRIEARHDLEVTMRRHYLEAQRSSEVVGGI